MGRLAAPADGRAERARLRAVLYTLAERESAGLYSGTLPWRCWLDRAARLGRYGFTNTLLIAAQWRAAIEVRSYAEWRARGRQVRKGETGVRILSPRGELRTVFDLAQTDGIPPEPERPVAPRHARRLLHRLTIDLGLDPGVADDHRNDLDDLGDLATAARLAHQLAHALRRGDRLDPPGEDAACRGMRRVEADSAAYLVLARLGLTSPSAEFPEVAEWVGDHARTDPLAAIRPVADRILRTADEIHRRLTATPPTPPTPEEPTREKRPALGPTPEPEPAQPKAPQPKAPQPTTTRPAKVNLATDSLAKNLASSRTATGRSALAEVQRDAHRFFLAQAPGSWVPGYLAERGFGAAARRRWQIGYAPAAWRTLTDHLRALGHRDETIVAAGLARGRVDGVLHDTFRDRAMFAIRTPGGEIAGFIGRRRAGGRGPKYLNSPETPLFRKGELLYGLYESRDLLAGGARPVIAEGPLDAIAVDIAYGGRTAVVSPCGTHLTRAQLDALAGFADLDTTGVLLALDGDATGHAAAVRAWPVLAGTGGPLGIAPFAAGDDPADVLKAQGPAGLRAVLGSEVNLAALVIDDVVERAGGPLETAEDRLTAIRAAATVLATIPPPEVAAHVVSLADRLQVPPATVTQALMEAISPHPTRRS